MNFLHSDRVELLQLIKTVFWLPLYVDTMNRM